MADDATTDPTEARPPRKWGTLERGRVKLELMRALATGEHTQVELARRYDADQSSISYFASRHAEEIADIRARLDDEFAGLWIAAKRSRIAEYQQQVDDIAELLSGAEDKRANVNYAEVVRTAQAALKAVAEELGQLPTRAQVEHSGGINIKINGLDVAALQ